MFGPVRRPPTPPSVFRSPSPSGSSQQPLISRPNPISNDTNPKVLKFEYDSVRRRLSEAWLNAFKVITASYRERTLAERAVFAESLKKGGSAVWQDARAIYDSNTRALDQMKVSELNNLWAQYIDATKQLQNAKSEIRGGGFGSSSRPNRFVFAESAPKNIFGPGGVLGLGFNFIPR